ncbi:hypothetical protein F4810DRAFT_90936 [Camillea tinctor]|nr:hypothetical protein F4810DRAFT_90936 [Camillea tinctor]
MDQTNAGWASGPYDHGSTGIQHNMDAVAGNLDYNQQYDNTNVPQGHYYEGSYFAFAPNEPNHHHYRAVHPNGQQSHSDLAGPSLAANAQHYPGVEHQQAPTYYHPYPAGLGDGGQGGSDQHSHGGQHQPSQFVHEPPSGGLYGQQILSQQNQVPHQLSGAYASGWAETHAHQNSPSPYGQPQPAYGNPAPQQQPQPQHQHQQQHQQHHWPQHIHVPSPAHTPTPPPSKRATPMAIDPNTTPMYSQPMIGPGSTSRPAPEVLIRQPPVHPQAHPQTNQYIVQQNFPPSRQESATPSYGNMAIASPQPVPAFPPQGYQHQTPMQFAQHMPVSRSPAAAPNRQSPSSSGQGVPLPQFQIKHTANPQAPATAASHANPNVSSGPQPVVTQVSRPEPDINPSLAAPKTQSLDAPHNAQTIPEQGWATVQGCPNLLVGTVPGRYRPVRRERKYEYIAKHNTSGTPLLPDRAGQLPCEIQRNYNEMQGQLNAGNNSESEQKKLMLDMQSLEKEMVELTGRNGILKSDNTTQPKRGAKRKTSQVDSSTDNTDASSNEDELSEQDRQAQLIMSAQKRPDDPEKGVEFDVVKIVYRDPKNPRRDQEVIHSFGDYVAKLWAEAKELRKRIESAQENGKKSVLPPLQEELTRQYKLIWTAAETALGYGDEFLIRNMGGNEKLIVILVNVLRVQLAAKDYNSPFAKTILKFMSRIKLRGESLTKTLKMDKVRSKYFNDLDEEGKKYMNQIFANADQQSAKQRDASNDTKKDQPSAPKKIALGTKTTGPSIKVPTPKTGSLLKKAAPEPKKIQPIDYSGLGSARKVTNGAAKPNASPSKRPRDDDAESRAPKKVAVEGATGAPATTKAPSASSTSSTTSQNPTATNTQPRPRPSGSLLLGKSRIPPKAPAKKPETQPSATSTISGLLAEIAKPAEKPKLREEPAKAPETAEEKARRLRKEARRGLRVTWKPDDELAEYRILEHDSAEDEGRADSMVRDARDNRSEGQMLKMQRTIQEDDDDDDGRPKDAELNPWAELQPINLAVLDASQREKAFLRRGGIREAQSEQKKVMEDHENHELVAVYTTLSEIPETPKSPTGKNADIFMQPKIAGPPSDSSFQEAHQRCTEVRQLGTAAALQFGLQRLGIASKSASQSSHQLGDSSSNPVSSRSRSAQRIMTQEERDAEVLALLNSDKVKNYGDSDPYDPADSLPDKSPKYSDPKVQQAHDAIEAVVAEMKDLPFPPTEPPKWLQSNPERVQEWHAGRNADIANKAKESEKNAAIRLAEEYARQLAGAQVAQTTAQTSAYAPYQVPAQSQAQQQGSYQSYSQASQQVPDQYAAILQQVQALQGSQIAQHTPQPAPAPVQPDTTNLHSLLAALGQSSQAAPAAPAAQPSQTQASNYDYWQAWAQNQAQSYGTQYDSVSYEGPPPFGTPPQRSQQTQNGQSNRDNNADRNSRKEFHRAAKDHKGINRSLIGTKPCTFWAKGQCAKGDQCTFRHDPNDLVSR